MLRTFRQRIPEKRNIATVFAVAMFLVYTWTLFTSFWKLPSWLFFLEVGDILSIYSYAFLVNFIESVMLVCLVLLPGLVLPRRWWLDTFVSRGFVFILVLLGSALLHLTLYRTPDTRDLFVYGQFGWWVGTGIAAVFLTWIAGKAAWICRALESTAERFLIFMYVYLPLTIFAILFVIARILL